MSDYIFAKKGSFTSLDSFAFDVFKILHVAKFEEHHSANYFGGRYFWGTASGIALKIYPSDEVGYDDYDFQMIVEKDGPWIEDDSYLQGCGDMIARILSRHGFQVTRALNPYENAPAVRRLRYIREWTWPLSAGEGSEKIRTEISTFLEEVEVKR